MGKKVKKKNRVTPKEKRIVVHSPKSGAQQSVECVDNGIPVVKEKKPCPHIDKGIDLNKLSAKFGLSEPVRCEDCREGVVDRRAGKGKSGKHVKKKGSASVDLKAIWVCLECGHYACGGAGFPTSPQTHAIRHARQYRHPIAIQLEKPQLRWCFPCDTPNLVEKVEDNGERKDVFSDVVKLIKGRSTEASAVDVEDVWFGSGSITSKIKSESNVSSDRDGRGGYMIRGLVNLGNTCFFNSIMQNLLALDWLWDYFVKLDEPVGPLTTALKKLFSETKTEAGLKNVINPRSFFGCVCSKAPQFRGYQQHDSHELLRCLLDALSTEESYSKKEVNSSQEDGISSNQGPTFVDAVFGGQISSTVCCVECGHSSTVYEPFLDLSLSVPTKKPPFIKAQPVSRAKKTKRPPKRGGRIQQKVNKDANSVPTQSVSNSSGISTLSGNVDPTNTGERGTVSQNFSAVQELESEQVLEDTTEQIVALSDDFTWMDYLVLETVSDTTEQIVALSDDFTWMDYLVPETVSDEHDLILQDNDTSVIQGSQNKDMILNDVLEGTSEWGIQVCSLDKEPHLKLDSSSVNSWEDELPLEVQGSQVLLLPYKEENTGEITRGGGEDSSSVVGCGQDELDFDGFDNLFNEPEIAAEPITKTSLGDDNYQANEVSETGLLGANISESDPDEVDNTDSPVSIETCLAHFIKPELLSNDNAWDCENCSKNLQRQRLESKKNMQANAASKVEINTGETRSQSDLVSVDKGFNCSTDIRNVGNGNIKCGSALNTSAESLVAQNGNIDCSVENHIHIKTNRTVERNPVVPLEEEAKGKSIEAAVPELSPSSSGVSEQATYSCSFGECTHKVMQSDSDWLAGECELEEVKDVKMDSKSVKVKRDATKRFLIYKAPPILTIHLKRFSQDAHGRLSKLNGHVNFRETINLRPYMDPRCTDIEKNYYRLVGVVEHLGTMRGGHYVAYVRGGGKNRGKDDNETWGPVWYHASDAYVREVSLDEVLRCEAYILFYEKT